MNLKRLKSMKMLRRFSLVLFFLLLTQTVYAEKLDRKLPVFAVIKPGKITTLISIGNGIVHKIYYQLGDKSRPGNILMEVLEKEGIRPYRNTIDGMVAKIHVTVGAATTVGMPLITVLDPKNKLLEVSLSPEEARTITPGLKVLRKGLKKPVAEVVKISPLVDPDKGSVTSYLKLLSPIKERIGEILNLEVLIPNETECAKVVQVSDLGLYTIGWQVAYLSGDQACLQKLN